METVTKKIVIAGSHEEYHTWCYENKTDPRHNIYARDVYSIKGVSARPEDVVYYGTWQNRKDIREINGEIDHIIKRSGVEL
jgi:hypothetical protein